MNKDFDSKNVSTNEIDTIKYKLYIQNKDSKKILFTSSRNGEGKTTLMVNLAKSMREDQKKVLIVGCETDYHQKSVYEEKNNGRIDYISSSATSMLMDIKSEEYDYIFFETEPLKNSKKAIRLANEMDMVVLVVETNRVKRNEILQNVADLKISSCKNVQVILNRYKIDCHILRKRG